jgi:hypothetical protein
MRRSYLLVAVALAAVVLSASRFAGIRHAFGKREHAPPELSARELERLRIREAMGDLLAPPLDLSKWPEHLRPKPGMPDRDTLRRALPRSNRPAWHDLREDRDAR